MRRCLPLALLLLAACKGNGHRAPPSSGHSLERGMFFTERDHHGVEHPISSTKPLQAAVAQGADAASVAKKTPEPAASDSTTTQVDRVADGATVDVNSRVDIRLLRDVLGQGTRLAPRSDLLQEARSLEGILREFGSFVQAQAQTAKSWRELQASSAAGVRDEQALQAFVRERRDYGDRVSAILEPVRVLWPKAERMGPQGVDKIIDSVFDEKGTATLTRDQALELLKERLQEKLDVLSAELAAYRKEVDSALENRKLRVEAFIVPAEGKSADEDPVDWGKKHAVHVDPHYDSLDAGIVRTADNTGLLLTESEREALHELMTSSDEIAKALNEIRSGEKTWKDAFTGARSKFAQVVGSSLAGIDDLVKEFEKDSTGHSPFDKRIEDSRKSAKDFSTGLRTKLAEWKDGLEPALADMLARLQKSVDDGQTAVAGEPQAAEQLLDLIRRIRELKTKWDTADNAALPQLCMDTLELGRDVTKFLEGPGLGSAVSDLGQVVRAAIKDLSADKREAVQALYQSSGLEKQVDGWKQLVAKVQQTVGQLGKLFQASPQLPHPTDLTNPASFDVALGIAEDPSIDLRKTTSKAGDYLFIHAQLLENDQKVDDLATTLRIEKLGWHADLVPSVVFVTADQLRGAEDNSGFSPALNWMWSYGPRDDQDDPFASRSLGWSAGMHAVFLHFAPDNAAEIGLGATVGLWGGRLQFGAGYNPFATDNQDGRFYCFIGSSLIPLLQALGGDK